MRPIPIAAPIATPIIAGLLLAVAGCSKQPESGSPAANAQALADSLEDKADNLALMADDDSTNAATAMALENLSDSLDQQSANLRAAAAPNEQMR